MFSFDISDSNLKLVAAILSTVIISYVFLMMSFSYTKKRANRHYAYGKIQAPSISSFSIISKIMFVTSMLLTLTSYWMSSSILLILYEETTIQFIGALLVLTGYINLNRAFKNLGNNYSPSFDAYIPSTLITTGSYRFIRHPIYLFNLYVSFGLAISSGSGIVAINAIIGLLFIIKIISMEEAYLKQHFPGYHAYSKTSWRLIPYYY